MDTSLPHAARDAHEATASRPRKTRIRPRVLPAALLLLTGPGGAAMAIEEPAYTVLSRHGEIELRAMLPHLVAETIVDAGFDQAANEGFRLLVRYIGGNNRRQEKISMTAPVSQAPAGEKIAMTAPVAQSPADQGYVISFVVPARYTIDTVPLPMDGRIRIREVPTETVAVLRYSGTWSQRRYAAAEERLLGFLAGQGLEPAGPARWARYNSPFSLPSFRRNEIIIPVRQPGLTAANGPSGRSRYPAAAP